MNPLAIFWSRTPGQRPGAGVLPRREFNSLLLLATVIAFAVPNVTFAAPRKAPLNTALNVENLAADSTAAIAVRIDVPKGLHAQSSKPLDPNLIPFTIKLKDGPATIAKVVYPEAVIENYPALGKVSVYTGKVTAYVVINVPKDATPGDANITGTVRYQMCDDSTCFAPVTDTFAIDTKIVPAGSPTPAANEEVFKGLDPAQLKPAATQPTASPATQPAAAMPTDGPTSLLGAIGLAIVAGIMFNIVPCVLPVLPLKAIGFYESSDHHRGRTMAFGLFFSLGVIAVFAILAVFLLAGKSIIGRNLQWSEAFSYPAVVWPMVILLVGLSLWLLGAFGVNLPTSIYGISFRHDTLTGNFMWGGFTAILSTPCTAPLFPLVLGWALTQPLWEGFTAIIFVGVGMALPYMILSAFPEVARRFPRTGPFSEIFKQMMAFLVLSTAAFLLGTRVLHDPNQWWLVFAVAVAAAGFLVIRTRQLMPSPRATAIASVLALAIVGSSFTFAREFTRPSKGFIPYTAQAFDDARRSGDIVLVKFTASWCLNCKYVEQTVFHDDATLEQLQNEHVRMLKADLTDSDAPGWSLLTEIGGNGIPFTAVWPAGKDSKPLTLASIYTREALLQTVARASSP